MNHRKLSTRLLAAFAATGTAALVVAGLAVGAGTSAAVPIKLALTYKCPFPLIGTQSIKVQIGTDIPTSIAVGTPTPQFDITAISTVPGTAAQGLSLVGATTIEGKAVADSTVTAPEATLPLKVPTTIPSSPVPAAGDFTLTATGRTPSLTFTKPGQAKITIGDLLLTLTPKKADGSTTGLGTFDSQCTQDPGQNNLLATIGITGGTTTTTAPPTTTTTVPPTTTTTTAPTTTAPPTTTTHPGGVKRSYDIKGTSKLAKLNGSVPLAGAIDANLDLTTGKYAADLTLAPTTGRFTLFGFLPLTSRIEFASVGKTTGSVTAGALDSASKLTIKLPRITIFGIPISDSPDCRSTTPSNVNLKSGPGFNVLTGGTLSGTYAISALTGCGPLNGLISGLTSGPGNTIDMTLTAKK